MYTYIYRRTDTQRAAKERASRQASKTLTECIKQIINTNMYICTYIDAAMYMCASMCVHNRDKQCTMDTTNSAYGFLIFIKRQTGVANKSLTISDGIFNRDVRARLSKLKQGLLY